MSVAADVYEFSLAAQVLSTYVIICADNEVLLVVLCVFGFFSNSQLELGLATVILRY